jgi:hypothetical protein
MLRGALRSIEWCGIDQAGGHGQNKGDHDEMRCFHGLCLTDKLFPEV